MDVSYRPKPDGSTMTTQPAPTPAFDRDRLIAWLAENGVAHATHDHPAVFRVEEGLDLKADLPAPTPRICFSRTTRVGCGLSRRARTR